MRTRLLVSMVMALCGAALFGCTEEDKDPPEVTEGFGVRITESEIQAEVQSGKLVVSFSLKRLIGSSFKGTLAVETLRLSDGVKGASGQSSFSMDQDPTAVSVTLDAPTYTSIQELGGYVLRYFVHLPDGSLYGRRSLFQAFKRSGLTVVGNNRFAAGEKGSLRILVSNPQTGEGVAGTGVAVRFTPDSGGTARELAAGKTGASGLYIASFTFTNQDLGTGTLSVEAAGHKSSHSILIEQERQVLLTTDKPLYQPGQSVYIRALAMKQPRVIPVSSESLLLEVEDAEGTKLYKKQLTTDSYGIAAVRFDLSRLLKQGTYTIRATMGTSIRTKTIRVEKYTLPKFKVKLTTLEGFVAPGAIVNGTVQADYFFNKPVAQGTVVLTALGGTSGKKSAEVQGKTDANGSFTFKVLTPSDTTVILQAKVNDASGAEATATAGVVLSSQASVLQLVPARKTVYPGDTSSLFVLLTDPAGKPMSGSVDLSAQVGGIPGVITFGGKATTTISVPASGLAEVAFSVGSCSYSSVLFQAVANKQQVNANLSCVTSGQGLRLSSDKALYKEGDQATVTVKGPAGLSEVTLEVLRHNASVHSETLKLASGQGTATLTLGTDMRRTLELFVHGSYLGKALSDKKLLFVAGQDQLTVTVTSDKSSYRPQEKGKVTLQLKDHKGNPAPGVLGVQVVDEALYALTEFKPGLERKVFFLEQEVISAGQSLRFISPDILLSTNPTADDQQKARLLFAAAGESATYPISHETGDADLKGAIGYSRYGLERYMNGLRKALDDEFGGSYYLPQGTAEKAREWLEKKTEGQSDDFGVLYKVQINDYSMMVTSAGMDEQWQTQDDLVSSMYYSSGYPMPYKDAAASADAGGYWPSDKGALPKADAGSTDGAASKDGGSPGTTQIRQYFPETLYVDPALITDQTGKATVDLTFADSITTWRLSTIAHTVAGQLGSTEAGLTVFQEFFVDTLLPTSFVQNDEVEVPVPVYNYTGQSQTVTVTVQSESWFTLLGAASQSVTIPAKSVGTAKFRIKVIKVGTFGFTATGVSATDSDGVKRSVEVLPDGEKQEVVFSGALNPGTVSHTVTIPTTAIAGAGELFVKVFPGLLSEVVEGFESILRQPYGCFEQTSSATYPNVLVMQYLKAAGQVNASLEKKAMGYIDDGYQKLLAYEVTGGGFSLWGTPPANLVLSAFGLMEFSDMAKVRYVDPALIARTQAWVVKQQSSDGAFVPPTYSYYEIPGNLATDTLRATAYTAWALQQSGYSGQPLQSALSYVRSKAPSATDPYSIAVAANALLASSATDAVGLSLVSTLKGQAKTKGDQVYWESKSTSMMYGYGDSMTVETTALVLGALILAKDSSSTTQGGLRWLAASKSSYGGYGTTQATILAIRTLLLALAARGGDKALGTVTVFHNNTASGTSSVTPQDSDVTRYFDLKSAMQTGANTVSITFNGSGELAYQVVGIYYLPHGSTTGQGPLTFGIAYDKTAIKVNESIKVSATVGNTGTGPIPTVLMRIGLPPGFSVTTSELLSGANAGLVQNVETSGPYLVVYLGNVSGQQTVQFSMTSSLEVKAKAPTSTAYPYYTPEYAQFEETPIVTVSP